MSQEKKNQIVQCCEKNNIPLSQAHILRNHKDRFGKPSTVFTLQINESNKDILLRAKTQLFCTDTVSLSHQYGFIKIAKINDLPYYRDYEEIVEQLYLNLKDQAHLNS